jgi:predicted kinase
MDCGGASAMAAILRENDECLGNSGDGLFAPADIRGLRDRSAAWLARVGGLLDRRRAAGKVRRCHGDLHLRNICVLDGKPVLFDCIEFADAFASIDVLYDLAFLLMDLAHQGHAPAANLVCNRYLDLTGEDDGLAAMPLFLSLRAAIRAHVTATAGASPGESRAYLDRARAALDMPAARLVAIGGLSGTGKSTLAAALAPALGAQPGARVLRSDVVRKRLFGRDPEDRLPDAGYGAETTSRVYAALCEKAAVALAAGYCAIIDAVALRPEERQSFAAVARSAGVPFTGIWLEAPVAALSMRVAARRGDASDATPKIVERQSRLDPGPLDWVRVNAAGSPAETLAALRAALAAT